MIASSRRWLRVRRVTLLAAALLISSPALSETPQEPKADASAAAQSAIEVIQGPRAAHLVNPSYPYDFGSTLHEGWVKLGFMVDTSGKPFEISVLESTGDKGLERSATEAIKRSTFEPGMLNGKPTESAGEMGYVYAVQGGLDGATSGFIGTYHWLLRTINAKKDKKLADDLLGRLEITNLYEDAYYGLALYQYARVWGTESMQLAGLKRAVAEWGGAMHLTRSEFKNALIQVFTLEIKAHQYVEALATWDRLQKLAIDPKAEGEIKAIVEQLNTLRSDERPYDLSDVVPEDGYWTLGLFKRHFRIAVDEGHISEVKLYCAKRYVYFAFDPTLDYTVNSQYGSCRIGLQGAPGTKFTLKQF